MMSWASFASGLVTGIVLALALVALDLARVRRALGAQYDLTVGLDLAVFDAQLGMAWERVEELRRGFHEAREPREEEVAQ